MKTKKICTCFECGYSNAIVDDSMILASYPPKYKYHCPKCGYDGCVTTNDVYEVIETLEGIKILNVEEVPTIEDMHNIIKPWVACDPNKQVTLYQLPVWKTYKDEQSKEQLIINLLDVKYLKSYEDRIDENYKTWRYFVYIKVEQAETDEIETSEAIYRQIERDLEMGE